MQFPFKFSRGNARIPKKFERYKNDTDIFYQRAKFWWNSVNGRRQKTKTEAFCHVPEVDMAR